MEFKDLNSAVGLKLLNDHLTTRSYISGYAPSQNDVSVFRAITIDLSKEKDQTNAKRWYMHMKSFSNDQIKSLPHSHEKIRVIIVQEAGEVKYMFYSIIPLWFTLPLILVFLVVVHLILTCHGNCTLNLVVLVLYYLKISRDILVDFYVDLRNNAIILKLIDTICKSTPYFLDFL